MQVTLIEIQTAFVHQVLESIASHALFPERVQYQPLHLLLKLDYVVEFRANHQLAPGPHFVCMIVSLDVPLCVHTSHMQLWAKVLPLE